MYYNHLAENKAIPVEYRVTADALFPAGWFSSDAISPGQWPDPSAAAGFADALGIGGDYQRILRLEKNTAQMSQFLGRFQNNLELLIQKTWVEKADEARKKKLQDTIPSLMSCIKRETYLQALREFGSILDELAYLFFGAQSDKDDFTEYAFRVDPQIGLFWWYGSQLGGLQKAKGDNVPYNESLWMVLLLGICYLTNF